MRRAVAKFGISVAFLVALASFLSLTNNDTWVGVWLLLFIFAGIPLFVLAWADLGRAFRNSESRSGSIFYLGVVFGLPQAIFGLAAVILGVAIIGLAVYNFFAQRHARYPGGLLALGLGPAALIAFGWSWLRDAFVKSRNAAEIARRPNNALERTRDG